MLTTERWLTMMILRTCVRMHASAFSFFFAAQPFSSDRPSFPLKFTSGRFFPMANSVRIAVVGDVNISCNAICIGGLFLMTNLLFCSVGGCQRPVFNKHDDWDLLEDEKALQFLQPDLVLFTGDFGNENVELVRSIANLEFPKAVILGNHDCWHTQGFSKKGTDRVQMQLECLGKHHAGYDRLDFPMSSLSIVGGRPFSCGGDKLFRPRLLSPRYGVNDMEGSTQKIFDAAQGTPKGHSIIFLAHNGPTGLGSEINDICGRDWVFEGGDHGDPDLAEAIINVKNKTEFFIPLVVFGHMHKELAYRNGLRKMLQVGADKTVYLNGAVVPRVKRLIREWGECSTTFRENDAPLGQPESNGTMREFTVIEILNGKVEKIAETWVSVVGDTVTLEEEHILFANS